MSAVATARQAVPAAPVFRGPLAGQRPRVVGGLRGDPWLVAAVAALLGLGIVMVFNVSYFYGRERLRDSPYFFRRHPPAAGPRDPGCRVAPPLPSATYRRAPPASPAWRSSRAASGGGLSRGRWSPPCRSSSTRRRGQATG